MLKSLLLSELLEVSLVYGSRCVHPCWFLLVAWMVAFKRFPCGSCSCSCCCVVACNLTATETSEIDQSSFGMITSILE